MILPRLSKLKTLPDGQAEALAEAGYRAAAVGLAIHDRSPVAQKQGDKDPKKWREWADGLSKAGVELAEAAKAKNVKGIRTAALKVNSMCTDCHGVFRD
jgi:hypothetical protein